MFYSTRHYGESWGNLCLSEVFSKTPKNAWQANRKHGRTFDPDEQQATMLDKLCVTRWKVCANCLKKIIVKYEPLLKLWKESLEEKLDAETKSRLISCKKQMESFKFYFGLQLGRKPYAHTDNLSRTLQQEKTSAIKGKALADLIVQTLEGIHNDQDYNLFCKSLEK